MTTDRPQNNGSIAALPPKGQVNVKQERQFRTALDPQHYMMIESEAMQRGLTPYRLVQIIVTMYLDGNLIPKPEANHGQTA